MSVNDKATPLAQENPNSGSTTSNEVLEAAKQAFHQPNLTNTPMNQDPYATQSSSVFGDRFGNPQPQVQPAPSQYQQQPPQPNQQQYVYHNQKVAEGYYGGAPFNWVQMGNLNLFHVNSTIASHELSLIEKSIKEVLDEHICKELDVTIIPVDKSSRSNLAVSVIVIAVSPKEDKLPVVSKDKDGKEIRTKLIAYHGLLIEGSIESLPPRYFYPQGNYGQPVEAMTLTSDLNDATLNNIIRSEVKRYFPEVPSVIPASNEVIPRNCDLTVRENVYRVMVNSLSACQAAIATVADNFKDINLARANKDNAVLIQTVRFNKGQDEDIYGNPIRSDITLDMMAQAKNSDPNALWRGEQQNITRVHAYIDLVYNDSTNQFGTQGYTQASQFGFNNMMQQQLMSQNGYFPQPVYTPQLVITQLLNTKVQSLAGTLLALINASAIAENSLWMQALLPDHSNGREDMNDIGNIGLDISLKNDGTFEKIITTPDVFGMQQLYQIAKQYFHNGLSIAIDVPECSQTSWLYKALRNTARGKLNSGKNMVVQAANLLTNGLFSYHYERLNGSGQFIQGGPASRITLGYYTTPEGVKRDKRDFDYLAVAGFAGKKGNRDEIISYTNSFNNARHFNIAEQLEIRKKIEKSYLPNLVYTGYAERLVFEATFIEALRLGAKDCGYAVNTSENNNMYNQMGVRSNTFFQNANMLLGETGSGIFTPYTYGFNAGYVQQPMAYPGGQTVYPNNPMYYGQPQQPNVNPELPGVF